MNKNQKRLYVLKKKFGSYDALSVHLGIPYKDIVWKYIKLGQKPGNREYCEKMGIKLPKLNYSRRKWKGLDEKAQERGWTGISEYLTAIINDEAEIPPKCEYG